jgi:hypothetical protein
MRPRHRSGPATIDEPVLIPVSVGSFGGQDPATGDREAAALTVTLDPDEVRGLRDVFERHHGGTPVDVESQWRLAFSPEPARPPIVLLFLRFSEFDVTFNIRFEILDHKRSLSVAARTARVILLEPALSQALLTEPPEEAFSEHMSIGLATGDVEPLRRALQGQFDIPLPENREPRHVVEPGRGQDAAFKRFALDARSPESLSVITTRDPLSIVVVHDPLPIEGAGDEEERWANWASLQAGPFSFARLDVMTGDRRLRSWLIGDPPQWLVRATSAGPHTIAVITEPFVEDDDAAETLRRLAQSTTYLVREAPEAMRALLR